MRSALPLDEPRHLCVDLPGLGANVDPDALFTVHACKDGMWNAISHMVEIIEDKD